MQKLCRISIEYQRDILEIFLSEIFENSIVLVRTVPNARYEGVVWLARVPPSTGEIRHQKYSFSQSIKSKQSRSKNANASAIILDQTENRKK